jgi:hypothetical protein
MAVISPHPPKAVEAYVEELKKQTDRGAGIVAAAVVEDALEFTIKRRLIELSNTRADSLFGRMRPLSSFSAKIELGFALGLYDDKLRRPLNMIRDIRNEFAHNMEATSFDHPDIAKLVDDARALIPEPAGQSLLQERSRRNVFMHFFFIAMMLLYASGAADIRLKPLGETHTEIFVQLALAAQEYQRAQASMSKAPPGTPGPQEPTPEKN